MNKNTKVILVIAVIIGIYLFGSNSGLFTISSTGDSIRIYTIENPSDPARSNYINPIPSSTGYFDIKFGVSGNSIQTNPIIACNGKKITSFKSISALSFSDGKVPKLMTIKGYTYAIQYPGKLSKSNGIITLHNTINFGSTASNDYIICEILNSNGIKTLAQPARLWFNGGY